MKDDNTGAEYSRNRVHIKPAPEGATRPVPEPQKIDPPPEDDVELTTLPPVPEAKPVSPKQTTPDPTLRKERNLSYHQ